MGAALILGGVVGGITALSEFSSAEAARANQKYQANVAASNAAAMRQQAELTRVKMQADQRALDRQREALRRDYEAEAGSNRALLAAGGVDITDGSAADVLIGNADRFATDVGENRLERAWVGWTGNREAQLQDWQGDMYDSQASYLRRTAGSLGKSLLSSFAKGTVAGVGTYMAAGGTFGMKAAGDGGGLGHVFDGNRTGGVGGGGWGRALGTR